MVSLGPKSFVAIQARVHGGGLTRWADLWSLDQFVVGQLDHDHIIHGWYHVLLEHDRVAVKNQIGMPSHDAGCGRVLQKEIQISDIASFVVVFNFGNNFVRKQVAQGRLVGRVGRGPCGVVRGCVRRCCGCYWYH